MTLKAYSLRRLRLYSFLCSLFSLIVVFAVTVSLQGLLHTNKTKVRIHRLPGRYDVILSAYMNSGSTFTGSLLGHRHDSFYFYEPLWRLSQWGYYRNNITMCSTRTTRCSTTAALSVPVRALSHLFQCNLTAVRNLVQPGVTPELSGPSWGSYRECTYYKRPLKCLYELESECKTATHRVSKVLRMSLASFETVLRNNPQLKIVHLFRDPRAIMNSRIETRGYPLNLDSNEITSDFKINTQSLCDKMALDFKEGTTLMSEFPDRIKFVRYEDVAENTHAEIARLYEWLGMIYERSEVDLLAVKRTNPPDRANYMRETYRKWNNAAWWRKSMTWRQVKAVDTLCYHVIHQLQYQVYDSENDMRDLNLGDF